jgi:transposase
MAVPWARTGSLFTRTFEDEVAWFMQKTNQSATAAYFGISWPTAGKIARRVVAEKLDGQLLENLRFLGIDEISYGRPRKFLTVVIDHERHRVVWAGEGQSAKTLAQFFELLGPQRCSAIEAVSIDMDLAFEIAIKDFAHNAEVVYDRFHIVQMLSRAVDEVRRSEVLQANPNERKQLKSSRYALLKNPWNLTTFQQNKLSTLQKTNKRIYRAYLLKETFQTIFDADSKEKASEIFGDWFQWARRSVLEPFAKLAINLKYRLDGILRFIDRKITNSPVEGMNSKIRMISHRAFGFRSAPSLIAMIQLNCSGITIQPIGL